MLETQREKIKKNWRIILGVLIFLILAILYFLFIFDIGLNSEYFAKRDFNSAFLARQTGNCNVFKGYVSEQYREIWSKRCVDEKGRAGNSPIKAFSVENITINQNKAFLQVKIERDIILAVMVAIEKELGRKFDGAVAVLNYDMQRTNLAKFLYILPKTRWIITNEIQ